MDAPLDETPAGSPHDDAPASTPFDETPISAPDSTPAAPHGELQAHHINPPLDDESADRADSAPDGEPTDHSDAALGRDDSPSGDADHSQPRGEAVERIVSERDGEAEGAGVGTAPAYAEALLATPAEAPQEDGAAHVGEIGTPHAPVPPLRAARRWPAPYQIALFLILVVGAMLRFYGLNWDLGSGLHPDERHIMQLFTGLKLPSSWSQFTTPGSPLEPGDFDYGSLPIYLYWIVGHVAIWLGGWVPGLAAWQNALNGDPITGGALIIGRVVSAASGVATIGVVYLLGQRLYGRAVGLLSAAFFALCVLDIQLSHFLAVDTMTTLFATLAVYFCVRVAQQRRPSDFLWAGACAGAALACKVSALPVLLPLVVAPFLTGIVTWRAAGERQLARSGNAPARALYARAGWLIAAVGALVVVFFVTQPYAFFDWSKYWNDVQTQANLASGATHIFYTDKFYNTPRYWYHLEHIVPWDLGWPLGLAAMAAVAVAAVRSLLKRRRGEAVLLLWTLGYVAATGGQFMKYVRYMLPIMPALCILAAGLLLPAALRARDRLPTLSFAGLPRWRSGLALGVLALTALYALAYDNIYTSLNTRLQASEWVQAHIKPGTFYLAENFDETLPWNFVGHIAPLGYTMTQIGVGAGPPTGDTRQYWTGGVASGPPLPGSMAATLARAQYVTITSVRNIGTIPHLPQAFPYSQRYYCLLFGAHHPGGLTCPKSMPSEALGFRLVASFSNHPNLFGLTLNDYSADQNFSEYDHPPVWIFQRVRQVSPARIAALITDGGRVQDVALTATPDKPLLLDARALKANATGPSYAQEFPANGLPMRLPILVWLLWLEAIGLLALPLCMRLFRRLPDRGVVLAKTSGLLLVGYLTWIAASLNLLRFNVPTILGSAVLVGLASLLWGVPLREVRAFWRAHRVIIGTVELVFLAGFAADVVVRMIYPDLWQINNGGEKEMDFSYLNSLVRSQSMPPADPWFGGGYMNYYYYGYYLVALLIKLTGIAPSTAYNLAVPTIFGLTLAGAFSVGYALSRRTAIALLAAGLTALAGNLYAGVQLGATLIALSPIQLPVPIVGGAVEFVGGVWQVVTQQFIMQHPVFPPTSFRLGSLAWGWGSTRVIDPPDHTINEFPFFSFLYADLHAHLIDLAAMVACLALAVNAALGARPWLAGGRREVGRPLLPGAGLVMVLAAAAIVGATGPTNTWDVATALILLAVGVAVSAYMGGRRLAVALVSAALFGVVLAVLAVGLYYPFYSHLKSFYSAIGVKLAHTELNQFLMVWGLFLFILASYIGFELWRGATGLWLRRQWRAAEFVLYYWPRRDKVRRLLRAIGPRYSASGRTPPAPQVSVALLIAGFALGAVALVVDAPVLALLFVLLGGATALLLEPVPAGGALLERPRRTTLMLAVLALGLAALCEIVHLADFNAGGDYYRMNTIFKLYEQAWPLFAVASAAALSMMLRLPALRLPAPRRSLALGIVAASARPYSNRERAEAPTRPTYWRGWRRLWLSGLVLLLIGVAVYPVLETPLRVQERAMNGFWQAAGNPTLGPTLDGTAFVARAFPAEYAALTWMNDHITGDPVVLSHDRAFYDNFAFRVQWMTGLPGVVQGNWEQEQQRYSGQGDTSHWPFAPYPDQINTRSADVLTIYSTTDTGLALKLLRQYHVQYIYVGIAERGQPGLNPTSNCWVYGSTANATCVGYPASGLAKFATMVHAGTLSVVYDRAGVTIYKVRA